jgi:hypothetical protein
MGRRKTREPDAVTARKIRGQTMKLLTPPDRTALVDARFLKEGAMRRFFDRVFNGPVWRTVLLMGVFGALTAYSTYNLLMLFLANFAFISSYGVMGLREGGLLQMIELVVWGYIGTAFYILFKGCLYGIIGRVVRH